jgi:pimeloyl-ACP methyl ester carboxylesterase
MPRRIPSLALAVAATLAAAAPAGAAAPPVPELDWHDCDRGFQCATAEVPRDYARPHGATVRLAVVRRPAVDQAHKIGSLFLNPGGPGGSAVDFVREAPDVAFRILPRFDWVGFDPRGVGGSEPAVDCDEPDPFAPMTPDTFDRATLLARARSLAQLCQNRDPAFLASLTTANAARDMDLLRRAVGDEQLSYVGLSWGGMLGETYASLFPGRARALVLDSPADGDVWLNDPFAAAAEQTVGFERSLQRFFAACAADRQTCRFGLDGPEDAFDDLVERLDATPIDLGDGRSLDGQDVLAIALESMYDKRYWPALAAGLAAAEHDDATALRALGGVVMGPGYDLLYDVFDSYLSVERRYPQRLAPYIRHAEHRQALAPHFGSGAYELAAQLFWPIRPRSAFYGPYRNAAGATPALILHTTHDPATPYEWGKRVRRDLGNARLLTYRGDGHGVVTELNPCIGAALVAYVEDQRLPPEGASCEQDVPFGAAAGARLTAAAAGARWRGR